MKCPEASQGALNTTAVLLSCGHCSLVRVSDNYSAAHARGKAHTSLSGHHALTYTVIEAPERIRLAQRVEKGSRKTVKGYVEDACSEYTQGVITDCL
jgi:hypothetical protein